VHVVMNVEADRNVEAKGKRTLWSFTSKIKKENFL